MVVRRLEHYTLQKPENFESSAKFTKFINVHEIFYEIIYVWLDFDSNF